MAIESALNDININDFEKIESLVLNNGTIDENPAKKIARETTPPNHTKSSPSTPKQEAKKCLIFDEENYRVVNLCPNSSNPATERLSDEPLDSVSTMTTTDVPSNSTVSVLSDV